MIVQNRLKDKTSTNDDTADEEESSSHTPD